MEQRMTIEEHEPEYVQVVWPPRGEGDGVVFEATSVDGTHVWEHAYYEDDPTQGDAGLLVAYFTEKYAPDVRVDVRRPTPADLLNIEMMRRLAEEREAER